MSETRQQKKTYIAITIGPIVSTMSMVTSPAALWASSFLFSSISRETREKLLQVKGITKESFIVPYTKPENEQILNRNDGVGLLHDHIIFEKPDDFSISDMNAIRDSVLQLITSRFTIADETFLKDYVLFTAAEFRATNPIRDSSRILDCMELATPFIAREKEDNPIISLFTGGDQSRNEAIKNAAKHNMGIDFTGFQLMKASPDSPDQKDIRSLGDLASNNHGSPDHMLWKKHRYYAILRSDGDNMGKLISALEEKDDFHQFSDLCLRYCDRVAKMVLEFGGMTVYVGGDDLLALLPCENAEGKTVFDFIADANDMFKGLFCPENGESIFREVNRRIEEKNSTLPGEQKQKLLPEPSLTYGVTICHYKHPLFEAVEDSARLLFGSKGRGYKNAASVHLIKHSGQTSSILIHNNAMREFSAELRKQISGPSKDREKVYLSALYKIGTFRSLIHQTPDESVYSVFENLFDAEAHMDNQFVHQTLPEWLLKLRKENYAWALDEKGKKWYFDKSDNIPDYEQTLCYLLRTVKFFTEKGGDRE